MCTCLVIAYREEPLIPNIEVSGMTFNQSVEFPLTQTDVCTLSGQLQTQNGTGAGGINVSWRHIFSHKSWGELELAAGTFKTVLFSLILLIN